MGWRNAAGASMALFTVLAPYGCEKPPTPTLVSTVDAQAVVVAASSAPPVTTPAAVGPTIAAAEALPTASSTPEPPEPPLPSRASALAGTSKLSSIIRRRVKIGRETDDACDARRDVDRDQLSKVTDQIGYARLEQKTRYASAAPYLGWSINACIDMCMSCLPLDDEERAPRECEMALTALSDLADELRAGK